MADVVTFGETMVRLSPPDHRRLEQTNLQLSDANRRLATVEKQDN